MPIGTKRVGHVWQSMVPVICTHVPPPSLAAAQLLTSLHWQLPTDLSLARCILAHKKLWFHKVLFAQRKSSFHSLHCCLTIGCSVNTDFFPNQSAPKHSQVDRLAWQKWCCTQGWKCSCGHFEMRWYPQHLDHTFLYALVPDNGLILHQDVVAGPFVDQDPP